MAEPSLPLRPDGVRITALRWWQVAAAAELDARLFGPEAWSPAMLWSELAAPDSHYVVARTDGPASGGLLGYAGCRTGSDEAWVQTIGVAPSAQRRGIGARLLAELTDHATAQGCPRIGLEVASDNAAAIALYHRWGFTELGIRRGYYQHSGQDALVLMCPLPPSGPHRTGGAPVVVKKGP